jgi:putative ABC transport system permease protein
MSLGSRFLSLLHRVTRRARIESDLDDELRATVEALAGEKMRAGASQEQARRAAFLELGGVELVKEQIRDVRAGAQLDGLAQDVRYALRLLRRNPLFTLIATLSLAVGIGANTVVFTIANGLLRFAPAAVADPARLVDIGRSFTGIPIGFNPGSYPDYLDIRRRTTTLDHVYAHLLFPQSMSLATPTGSEPVLGEIVTTNYFAALGTRPGIGRLFLPDERDQQGASPVVVLSHRFWTRQFNADPGVVGRTLRLNRYPLTVVGVAPDGFHGTTIGAVDLWVPMSMVTLVTSAPAGALEARNAAWVVMGARLRPGATVEKAAAELDVIDRALREEFPSELRPRPFRLSPGSPMADKMPAAVAALVVLGAIVSTILVIACANLAGLLLARAAGRRREMALRLAIGAGRGRLIKQLLTETLILFALGAASGVLLARVVTGLMAPWLPTLPVPLQISLALDWRVVCFACGLSLLAALLSGLAPALHASRADVSTVLKDEASGVSGRSRMRNAFVVAQVSLSLLLVVVGGLFARALQQPGSSGAGFDSRGVEVVRFDLSALGYTATTGPGFARQVLDRIRRLPGVEAASMTRSLPLASEGLGFGVSLPGATPSPGRSSAEVTGSGNIVEPGYFAALRIPLVAGRDFTDKDGPGAPQVAIVGEATARRFWPARSAIGQSLVVTGPGMTATAVQVVGVARDVQYRSLDFGTVPFVYIPHRQHYQPESTLVVRSSDGRSAAGEVRRLLASTNAALALVSVRSLEETLAAGLMPQRVGALVAGGLGVVGVLLAAIGLYGVTAYTVARRTREIAIRVALGAQRAQIVALTLRQAFVIAAVGSAVGLPLAAIAGRVLSILLVGVSPIDPTTFLAGVLLLGTVSLAASYGAVHRALRIEASDALKCE